MLIFSHDFRHDLYTFETPTLNHKTKHIYYSVHGSGMSCTLFIIRQSKGKTFYLKTYIYIYFL